MQDIDWLGKPYYSLNAYFKHTYGQKCYKIAVDAGLTCPNRDGSLDTRGCIFCSVGGSGDFAVHVRDMSDCSYNVETQIKQGLERFNKSVGDKFVIYFQAFTNTYGDVEYLRKIWSMALEHESVIGISIATRPDCLGAEVMSLLAELKEKYHAKFIWVELGLQTIHEETAAYIRRNYSLEVYDEAVRKLSTIEIPYITHIILGLPGETEEMMLETVKYVNAGGLQGARPFGVKLQLLHVLEDTNLAEDYKAGLFNTLEMDGYLDIVIRCLQNINPDIVIHRVTGDGPKNILISPTWSGNKKLVLNTLHRRMREMGAMQGDFI